MKLTDCKECDNKSGNLACGRFHVYVIELSLEVLEQKKFHPNRETLGPETRCFYVGQTRHRPYCRYTRHAVRKSANHFECSCFSQKPKKTRITGYNHGNRFVRDYRIKGGLRPEFYSHLNPLIGSEESKEMERKVASDLIDLGFAVHSN